MGWPRATRTRGDRAERRAAKAAAIKARAEQAEKERKQRAMIGATVSGVLSLVAIGAFCVYHNIHKTNVRRMSSRSSRPMTNCRKSRVRRLWSTEGRPADFKNGYGKSWKARRPSPLYGLPVPQLRLNHHRQLDEDLQKMINAGQINLDLHLMAFMDRWSDEYSSRAANAAMYLAEARPSNPGI